MSKKRKRNDRDPTFKRFRDPEMIYMTINVQGAMVNSDSSNWVKGNKERKEREKEIQKE